MDTETIFFILMAIIIGFIVGVIIVWFILDLTTQSKCLELGWASSEITWNFQAYCIREENEYEITKPLKELLIN